MEAGHCASRRACGGAREHGVEDVCEEVRAAGRGQAFRDPRGEEEKWRGWRRWRWNWWW